MSTADEGSLTLLAKAIQTQNQQFQKELTDTMLQAVSHPAAALARLNQCGDQIQQLEQSELGFLQRMGDWGAQQVSQAQGNWRETRLQIQAGKAQVLVLLGRYGEAQLAINAARPFVTDPNHPAGAMLDELEIAISQAKG
jgi:hypothetical protein